MKKKILTFILLICFSAYTMVYLIACRNSTTSQDIEFEVKDGYVQYYDGETWTRLIAIEDLRGETGKNGIDGEDGSNAAFWSIGDDGYWYKDGTKTAIPAIATNGKDGNGIKGIIKDSVNSTKQISKYIITFDDNSTFTFEVTNGIDGEDLNREKYTVTFDYNNPLTSIEEDIKDYANKATDSLELSHGSWCGDEFPNYDGTLFEDSFKGWFIKDTDIEITKYDNIGGDITLVAKWENINLEAENCSFAEHSWISNGCAFYIDLTKENVIVPDYYKTNYGIEKVTAIRRPDECPAGAEYALKSIKLPAFLTKFLLKNVAYPDGMFEDCVNLKEIDIPESVTSIGEFAFANCTSLESIKLPNDMTALDNYAFYGCTNLKNVVFPKNINTIGRYAFYSCNKLKTINIPNGVTDIGMEAFDGCNNLKTLYLPSTLKTIQCDLNVENLYYGGTIEEWLNIDIGNSFEEQLRLFGDNTSFFMKNEYDEMYEVTELYIPDTVTEIKDYAFNNFAKLTKLVISDSVKSIGTSAFNECRKLVYANLGNGIETIGDYALSTCTRLETLIMPTSVKSIGEGALGLNGALIDNASLFYKGTKESWDLISKKDYYAVFSNFDILYYSETTPTGEEMYWHYDTDGITPIAW